MGKSMSEQRISWNNQLRDPRWQRVKAEVMQAAGYKCVVCNHADKTLNTHHTYYQKGLMAWEYPRESLLCMCEDCHARTHSLRNSINLAIATFTPTELESVYQFSVSLRDTAKITRQQMREKYSRPLPARRDSEGDDDYLRRVSRSAMRQARKPITQLMEA
jgi:hypothetical protein